MLRLNDSGQGFSVFRLLISAIMGLMILLIILAVSDYFYQVRLNLGYNRIIEGFNTAANKPDGTVVKVADTELPAGTVLASKSISVGTGISQDCIILTGEHSSFFSFPSDRAATIDHTVTVSVYIKCETSMEGCDVYCTVSLNKKLQ